MNGPLVIWPLRYISMKNSPDNSNSSYGWLALLPGVLESVRVIIVEEAALDWVSISYEYFATPHEQQQQQLHNKIHTPINIMAKYSLRVIPEIHSIVHP